MVVAREMHDRGRAPRKEDLAKMRLLSVDLASLHGQIPAGHCGHTYDPSAP